MSISLIQPPVDVPANVSRWLMEMFTATAGELEKLRDDIDSINKQINTINDSISATDVKINNIDYTITQLSSVVDGIIEDIQDIKDAMP